MHQVIVLSDVHLQRQQSPVNENFIEFLHTVAAMPVKMLYILGDLFDVWLGDDDISPAAAAVLQALKALNEKGCMVFIQHGNRDFMLGMRFARSCGATLLPDVYVLETANTRWLLTHGDMLVADKQYLRYRRIMRHPLTLAAAAALPLFVRRRLAAKMRSASKGDVIKAEIDDNAAIALMRQYNCQRLIHGHLHRSSDDVRQENGIEYRRWCLPAWEEAGGYATINMPPGSAELQLGRWCDGRAG